jgi:O-antigen ligase
MNPRQPRLSGAIGAVHPAVLQRRVHDGLLIGLAALIPAAIALGIIVAVPDASLANIVLVLAAIAAVLGVAALVASSRLEVTVTLLALYLLLMYGPVKLGLGGGELAHGADDVLILAICVGAVMRLMVRREPVSLPPLFGWVLAFVATVALEAFNPKTGGILKVLGGFRQELHWVPFFFFGYLLIRSKKRIRQAFLIAGVCALANGVAATYQTGLSPAQLATWGPGYRELFQPTSLGKKGASARVYSSEGGAHPRPVGLGSDGGFSGGVGLIALPFCLALLATWRSRRRWVAAVLALGAIAGVATGAGRLQVVGAVLSVVAFLLLASLGGRRVKRPLGALLIVLALAIPLGVVFVSVVREGAFSRYGTFENTSASTIATHKSSGWTKIPSFLARNPFGIGLGTTGPVGGFGGKSIGQGEGGGASAETQYNFIADELGAPGLVVWVTLSVYIVVLVARRLRAVRDGELAILLAAAFAPFIALIFMGFSGPSLTSTALGPYFWFAVGIAAYWFAGRARDDQQTIAAGAE